MSQYVRSGVGTAVAWHPDLQAFRCAVMCCLLYRLADLKLKEPAIQMLLAAAEAAGPQLVASLLHKRAVGHKNPKVTNISGHFIASGTWVAQLMLWIISQSTQ